jgi:hypothetical protein
MNLFIKEYLHSEFDDSLVGKYGFFANDESSIQDVVNNVKLYQIVDNNLKNWDKLEEFCNNTYPFWGLHNPGGAKLFYHDPYYYLKEAVVVDGETLEVNIDNVWTEVTDLESFFTNYPNPLPPKQYRTEKNRRIVTHRELAKWLADGKGQVCYSPLNRDVGMCAVYFSYHIGLDDKPVENLLIRSWDDVAWHLPTASYLRLKD